jgi:O-antigen/teichoic acid export membrane protein/glycosyltransferase involved in cell wall biosynthesis
VSDDGIYLVTPGGENARGGIGRMVRYLAREWRGRGGELRIVDSYGPDRKLLMPAYFAAALARVAGAAALGRVRLLHVNMAERGSVWRKGSVVWLGAACGVPVLVHCHGADFADWCRGLGPVRRRLLAATLRRAERLLVLGSSWRAFAVGKLGIPAGKVEVLPNAVATPPRRAPDPDLREAVGPVRLLFLGRLGDRKGVPELLQALAAPAVRGLGWTAVLAGDGEVGRFRTEVVLNGLDDRVRLAGWVDEDEAGRLLVGSDVLVLPSRNEGLPMAVLEANGARARHRRHARGRDPGRGRRRRDRPARAAGRRPGAGLGTRPRDRRSGLTSRPGEAGTRAVRRPVLDPRARRPAGADLRRRARRQRRRAPRRGRPGPGGDDGAPLMLLRSILGYTPANLVPALAALGTIVAFTRLLPPDEFGRYALAQAVILFGQALAFFALQVSVTRFHERYADDHQLDRLLATAYWCYLACAAIAAAIFAAIMVAIRPDPLLAPVLWLALPTLLLRGLVVVNLASHRGAQRIGRYNLVECGQNVAGFLVALALVAGLGLGASGLVLGMLAGSALVLLADLRTVARGVGPADRAILRELWTFGAPLVVAHALNAVTSYIDRLFVERLLGPFAVGLYVVAYAVAERAVSLVFMGVTLGAFPLAVAALEREGPDAARRQLARNCTALLALGVPTVVGTAGAAPQIADVLVGGAYHDGVIPLIPWIAGLAFLRGLSAHFFDQALHLGQRTDLFLYTLGPAALLTLTLNPLLLPEFGLAGAVAAAFVAQTVTLLITIAAGRRVFALAFPLGEALRVAGAAATMAAALGAIPFPRSALGLAAIVGTGVLVYGAAALALNVAGVRRSLAVPTVAGLAAVPALLRGARSAKRPSHAGRCS